MRLPLLLTLLLVSSAVTGQESLIVPVAGTVSGGYDARFRSTLHLVNRTNRLITGDLRFTTVEDSDGRTAQRGFAYRLGPWESLSFEDAAAAFDTRGLGSLEITAISGGLPTVETRAFDEGGEGTFGLAVPALPADFATAKGERTWILVPSDLTRYRANVGVRTVGTSTFLDVRTFGSDGRLIRENQIAVRSRRLSQIPASLFSGGELSGGEILEAVVTRGAAHIYLATIDNVTNDSALFVAPSQEMLEAAEAVYLPVSGSVSGAFGSEFRTTLSLLNPGSEEISGTIRFVSAEGEPVAEPYQLSPLSSVVFPDVVETLGGTGLGSLVIEPKRGYAPVVDARAYEISSGGTAGVTIPALLRDEAVGSGESTFLLIPDDLSGFRMNVGYRVLEAPLQFETTVFDGEGVPAGETGTVVHRTEGSLRQMSVDRFAGVEQLPAGGSIRVRVTNGEAFFYSTLTDNRTNDSSLQLERIVNQPPGAGGDARALEISAAADGTTPRLLTIRDVDDDEVEIYVEESPKHGSLTVREENGRGFLVEYTIGDFEGVDEAVLIVEDERGGFLRLPVSVEVERTGNAEPQAVDSFAALVENTSLSIPLRGVDTEGGELQFEITEMPLRGALGMIERTGPDSGKIRYTPEENYHGKDRFEFRVTDPGGRSDTGVISIEVSQSGDLPTG